MSDLSIDGICRLLGIDRATFERGRAARRPTAAPGGAQEAEAPLPAAVLNSALSDGERAMCGVLGIAPRLMVLGRYGRERYDAAVQALGTGHAAALHALCSGGVPAGRTHHRGAPARPPR
ncbi:MAG: hypothetical protein GXY85_01010 [Candidatus Brocadiaceae bacterium]|nr:hypothetical protein [Candidatus Brocadiaceae bacterium]